MICGYSDQQSGTDRFGSTQLDMVGESFEVLNDGGKVSCALGNHHHVRLSHPLQPRGEVRRLANDCLFLSRT